jgi:hypothetical protein
MNKNLKASMLTGIRALESKLSQQQTSQALDDLPPGHPLLEAAQQEETRGSEIADLPEGHPLKVALREAQERFVAQQAEEKKQQERQGPLQVKKAKRLADNKAFRERIDVEEQERERKRDGYKAINEKIDNVLRGMDELLAVAKPDDDMFGEDQFSRLRVSRLQRLVFASRRGLADSRLRTVGV